MSKAPKYFMYFPGNYRWSAAFVNMLGTAPFGGVDMSELHAHRPAAGREERRGRRGVVRCLRQGRRHRARPCREVPRRAASRSARLFLSARLSLLSDGRALPHAEGCARARRLPQGRRLLSSIRRAVRQQDRNRRRAVRRQEACPAISCRRRTPNPRVRPAWCSSTASISPRRFSSCAACPISCAAAFRCW